MTFVREMKTEDEIREKKVAKAHPNIPFSCVILHFLYLKQRRYVQSLENGEKKRETIAVKKNTPKKDSKV